MCLADGPVTLMLHKPAGVITSMSDPQGRPTVATLVPTKEHPGLFPIGRLDFDTTGLLLFSTDGELGSGLLHPRRHVMKYYLALVEGAPTSGQIAALSEGVMLDDGLTLPADVALLEGFEADQAVKTLALPAVAPPYTSREYAALKDERVQGRSVVRIGIREGRKRQVRRMFAFIGHPVLALHRASFGPLELGDTERGQWRELTQSEVRALEQAVRDI